jgi:hypothetical protein
MSYNSGSLDVGTLSATFALNSSAATASISSIINQTNTLKQSFTTNNILKVDSTQAVANINKATDSANLFKKALEFGGALLAIDLVSKAFDGVKSAALGTNAAIEQAQLKFTALSGSAQTASTLMGQLETLAAHSTFGLTQITAAAGGLEAFGVNVANIPPLLQAMQNAAAAAGGDMSANFNNLARILGELAGGLPLTERQVRQLVTAGIPLQPLAQQLGITVDQLLNVGKTGIVTGDQLVAAFAKVYTSGNLGDFMQKQAGTFNGALALIKTNVSLAAATAFKPLFDTISALVVKFGEFVQTPTFNQWVSQIQQGMTAVIGLFKEFAAILAPIGDALAKFFGLDTGNISAQMDAVSKATVDVGTYNAALQDSGAAAGSNKEQLQGYKDQVDAASAALLGLNTQLADNQVLLDANARAIAAVKNQYDPIIKSAEQSIKDINTPTADELSRKTQELQLDRDRANLELTKPDTSVFDTRILGDQTTLDNMPALDTSTWDTNISGYQAQIQALQESISGLNTDAFDEKINAIRDKLAEPAPDTTGITNQLAGLNAELAGGTISKTAFDQQYGALSLQKQGVITQHQQDTTGLQGQLKLLTQQRADQALANKETAQADRQRISDLQDQVKIQEKGRSDAQKADAKARKDLQDDIKDEGMARTAALKPYTDAMKKITDQQAINSNLDKAAAAQKALDLAPYQLALDKAKATEADLLAPLLAQKQTYDDNKTSLTEARKQQELAKSAAEGQATALKDAAANAKLLGQNLNPAGGAPKATLPLGGGAATAALGVGANLGAQLDPSPFVSALDSVRDWLAKHKAQIQHDFSAIGDAISLAFTTAKTIIGDVADGLGRFVGWLDSGAKGSDIAKDAIIGLTTAFVAYQVVDDLATAATIAFTASLDVNPVFLAISAIAGLTAGLIVLYNTSDTAKGIMDRFLAANVSAFSDTFGANGVPRQALAAFWQFNTDGFQNVFGETGAPRQKLDAFLTWSSNQFATQFTDQGLLAKAVTGFLHMNEQGFADTFGDGSPIRIAINGFGSFMDGIFGDKGSIAGMFAGLGKVFDGLGSALQGPLSSAGKIISGFMGGIGDAVHAVGKLFGIDQLANFNTGTDTSAALPNGQVGPPVPAGLATGTLSWQGGAAIVGEAGRELINRSGRPISDTAKWELTRGPTLIPDLPRGATVLPNSVTEALLAQGVPGFAGGLLGDIVGGIASLAGNVVGGAASGFAGLIPDMSLPGLFAGVGPALVKDAKDGVASLISSILGKQSTAQSLGAVTNINLTGPTPSGGYPDVINAANNLLGDGGYNECERWVGDVLQAAGYYHPRYGTAQEDDFAQPNFGGTPPYGATVLWGFGPAGHVAFGGGDGSFLGTVNANGGAVGWQPAGTYGPPDGWRPPGLAEGGSFSVPTTVTVGDGGQREFVLPESDLRSIVRAESGGTTITIAPGAITVTAPPGVDGQTYGRDFGAGFLVSMRERGRIPTG